MAVPRPLQSLIAPQAWGFAAALAAAVAAAALLGWTVVALVLAGLLVFNMAFFRNPRRTPDGGAGCVVAPGDGKVVEVRELDEPDSFVGPAIRVAIFLSVFDVHVNRVPIDAKVRSVTRSGSKFLAAFNEGASALNVQSRMDLESATGTRVGVVQITGLIARRIICYAQAGEELVRGEPYGLICYGSRMELILPATAAIAVKVGQRVRSGESVIGEVPA